MGRGVHRGFITYEELNKSLGKRNLSSENLEKAFLHILDEKISLVEKKSDFFSTKNIFSFNIWINASDKFVSERFLFPKDLNNSS